MEGEVIEYYDNENNYLKKEKEKIYKNEQEKIYNFKLEEKKNDNLVKNYKKSYILDSSIEFGF